MHRIGQERREFLRDLDSLCRKGALGQWSDASLLERFAGDRSEQAFAALVDRHGPMVLRICRAVAGDAHAAEDAFQAVFLVLAGKAGSLRIREGLGPWLRTVAIRVATNARHAESRRKRREALAAHRDRVEDRHSDPDMAHALYAEIDRLPARLREVVLTCDVEGLSHGDAALRLNCPVGTVKSRHSRGRARLRERLARRGIAPLSVLDFANAGRPPFAVPDVLRSCTVRGALILSSSGSSEGMAPTLAHLVSGGSKTMMTRATSMTKLGLTLLGLVLGIGTTLLSVSAQGPVHGPEVAPSTAPERTPQTRAEPVSPSRAPADAFEPPAEFVLEPPTHEEIYDALVKKSFPEARVHVDKTGETAERPRIYPLAGLCQQVTVHYKCTIDYLADPRTHRRGQEVVYVNKDHLRRVPKSAPSPPDAKESPRNSDHAPSGDQERRLRSVEEKLDRLLKVLETDQDRGHRGGAR